MYETKLYFRTLTFQKTVIKGDSILLLSNLLSNSIENKSIAKMVDGVCKSNIIDKRPYIPTRNFKTTLLNSTGTSW